MTDGSDASTVEVTLEGVTKRFDDVVAVDNLTLRIEPGRITTLLGPSGCGKTTTLRLIAGFYQPNEGDVRIDGKSFVNVPPHKRPTRTVFQNYALFPHMSVAENVAFGLRRAGQKGPEAKARVGDALEMVGLAGLEERQPGQLSGGQQQRVALARALVTEPKVLLLDEPLSNLDAKLRVTMRDEIRELQRRLSITTIYVTHDQEEALSLSDQVAVMHDGNLLQLGPPTEIYERPAARFVAEFLGLSNFLTAEVVGSTNGSSLTVRLQNSKAEVLTDEAYAPGTSVVVGVRPENLVLATDDRNGFDGVVKSVHYLGNVARYYVDCELSKDPLIVDQHAPKGSALIAPGGQVTVEVSPGRGYVHEDSSA